MWIRSVSSSVHAAFSSSSCVLAAIMVTATAATSVVAQHASRACSVLAAGISVRPRDGWTIVTATGPTGIVAEQQA